MIVSPGFSSQSVSQSLSQPQLVRPASVIYDNTVASLQSTPCGSLAAAAAVGAGEVCAAPSPDAVSAASVSLPAILQVAQSILSESLVRKVNAVYQFELQGEGGGVYYVNLKHGESFWVL